MVFLPNDRSRRSAVAALVRARLLPNGYDLVAFALLVAAIVLVLRGGGDMRASLDALSVAPVSLDIGHLPEYALRTTLRMFAAIIASLIFTFIIATLAAKSRRAEPVIVPALDILQSVPVLGFLTFTVTFFMGLFPGSQLGAECASIFAIFTSQAWNVAFSFYQSLRTVPHDLDEVSRGYGLSTRQRFWRLEAPFAAPGLIWNTMMSMSGGWFFVVASEAITVGNTTVQLPGIRLLPGARHRSEEFFRRCLGCRHDGGADPSLRPVAVPPDRRLGGEVPLRADGEPGQAAFLGLQHHAAHAVDEAADGALQLGVGPPDACPPRRRQGRPTSWSFSTMST